MSLLDPRPFPAERYGALADRLGCLIGCPGDVLWVQGEAILALEALATSLSRPGLRAVNVVTSPYGALFGGWLRRGGAQVVDVVAPAGLPVSADAVEAALRQHGADVVALVHAESASGICNPLEAIAALAHAAGAIVVVDAVASVGGHPLDMARMGLDAVVVGPQKGLAGPSGLSAVALSPRAWALIDRPDARRASALALMDLKAQWLDTGRGALPGMPAFLEWWALDAALDRIEVEGLEAVIARHQRARRAARAAIQTFGLRPWVAREGDGSALVTAAAGDLDYPRLPPMLRGVIEPAIGDLGAPVLRMNHTGSKARPLALAEAIVGLGDALGASSSRIDEALEAAAWA